MASIGSLTLDLRANAGEFHQELGRARTSLGSLSRESGASQHALSSFAAKGLGSVIPAAQGAEFAINRMLSTALRGRGALLLLGQAGAIVGGTLLVAAGFQKFQDEMQHFLKTGTFGITAFLDQLKKDAEEQEKFAARRVQTIGLLIGLEGKLGQARASASQAALTAMKDEPGAAGAGLERELTQIALEEKLREGAILKDIKMGADRERALTLSTQIGLSERRAAVENYYATLAKIEDAATAKTLDTFKTETSAQLENLQRRLEQRKRIEESTAALIQVGTIVDPLGEAEKTREAAKIRAEGFALLLDKGRRWADLEAQIFAAEREFDVKGLFNFGVLIEEARTKFQNLGIDALSIQGSLTSLAMRLGDDLPASINRADPAIVQMIQRFQLMRLEANQTAIAVQQLANVIAAGGPAPAPIVGAPVDLGFPSGLGE